IRFIDDISVGLPAEPDKSSGDTGCKMLLDLGRNIPRAGLVNVTQTACANCLSIFGERFVEVSFQEFFKREVNHTTEKSEQQCEQARVPCSESKTYGARIHGWSSVAITYPVPLTVRIRFCSESPILSRR